MERGTEPTSEGIFAGTWMRLADRRLARGNVQALLASIVELKRAHVRIQAFFCKNNHNVEHYTWVGGEPENRAAMANRLMENNSERKLQKRMHLTDHCDQTQKQKNEGEKVEV